MRTFFLTNFPKLWTHNYKHTQSRNTKSDREKREWNGTISNNHFKVLGGRINYLILTKKKVYFCFWRGHGRAQKTESHSYIIWLHMINDNSFPHTSNSFGNHTSHKVPLTHNVSFWTQKLIHKEMLILLTSISARLTPRLMRHALLLW